MMRSVRSATRRVMPAIAAVMLLGGCDDRTRVTDVPQGALRVEPERARYAPGNRVELTLHNDSTSRVYFGPCAQAVLHLVGGDAWGEISGYDSACDAIMLSAEPGSSRTVAAQLPSGLPRGLYRTRHDYRFEGDMTRVQRFTYSAPFEVR